MNQNELSLIIRNLHNLNDSFQAMEWGTDDTLMVLRSIPGVVEVGEFMVESMEEPLKNLTPEGEEPPYTCIKIRVQNAELSNARPLISMVTNMYFNEISQEWFNAPVNTITLGMDEDGTVTFLLVATIGYGS